MTTFADLRHPPSLRVLRQFAASGFLVFGTLAVWHGTHGRPLAAMSFGVLASLLGAVGLWRTHALRWPYTAALVATLPLGWLVSRFVLGVIFYGIVTPLGLGFRLARRDVLRRRPCPDLPTYWRPKPEPAGAASYFRQF